MSSRFVEQVVLEDGALVAPCFCALASSLQLAIKEVTAALKSMSTKGRHENVYDNTVYQVDKDTYLILYHRVRARVNIEIKCRDDGDYTFDLADIKQFVVKSLERSHVVRAFQVTAALAHPSQLVGFFSDTGYAIPTGRQNRLPSTVPYFYHLSAIIELAMKLVPEELGEKPSKVFKDYIDELDVVHRPPPLPGTDHQIGIDMFDPTVYLKTGIHIKQLHDKIIADTTPDYSESVRFAAAVMAKVGSVWCFKLYDAKNQLYLHREQLSTHVERRFPSVHIKTKVGKKTIKKEINWLALFEKSTIPVAYTQFGFYPATDVLPTGVLNLWQGWTFAHHDLSHIRMEKIRDPESEVNEILAFVFTFLCGGEPDLFWGLIHWFAAIVQRPWEKTGRLLQITGPKGCGKSSFVSFIFKVLGPAHVVTLSRTRDITGSFNSALDGKLIVEMSEACTKFEPAAQQELKSLVTDAKMNINEKFKALSTGVDSFTNIVMTSNLDTPIIHEDVQGPDRRALVIEALPVPAEIKKDLFDRLHELYNDEEVCLRFGFLLANLDLSLWAYRVHHFVFDSPAYQRQKFNTLPPAGKLMGTLIQSGRNVRVWETGDKAPEYGPGGAVHVFGPAVIHPSDAAMNTPQTDQPVFPKWYLDCSLSEWQMWALRRSAMYCNGRMPSIDELSKEIIGLGCDFGLDDRLTFPRVVDIKANFLRLHGIDLDLINQKRAPVYDTEKKNVMRWYLELDINGNPAITARTSRRRRVVDRDEDFSLAESQNLVDLSRANSFADPSKMVKPPGTPTTFAAFNASLSRTPLDPRDRINSPGKLNPLHTDEEVPDSQDFDDHFGHSDSDSDDNSSVGGRDLMDE